MPNRPIILADWQVRAAQEGRLKQIRVPVVPQPPEWIEKFGYTCFTPAGHISGRGIYGDQGPAEKFFKLPFSPKDILYAREVWANAYPDHVADIPHVATGKDNAVIFKASFPQGHMIEKGVSWHSPATMPKEATRLFLPVGEVRAQRLGEMTEEDARAEGCISTLGFIRSPESEYDRPPVMAREARIGLWEYHYVRKGYPWAEGLWTFVGTVKAGDKE